MLRVSMTVSRCALVRPGIAALRSHDMAGAPSSCERQSVCEKGRRRPSERMQVRVCVCVTLGGSSVFDALNICINSEVGQTLGLGRRVRSGAFSWRTTWITRLTEHAPKFRRLFVW